ncbi:MAG TPA: hypothetical protein VF458_01890 [Ktedonobacteraceae bacterium]
MMESTPESSLQQSANLAQQAAAQMKRAANLAENAAQLWQKALALANLEVGVQSPAVVEMTVSSSKRKKKQHIKPEMTLLLENTAFRQAAPEVAGEEHSAQPALTWEDGDDWWKPRQQAEPSET